MFKAILAQRLRSDVTLISTPFKLHLALLIATCCSVSVAGAAQENYWPTQTWRTATPEMQGIDSNALADALAQIRERKIPIHSLLIERNGYVILDAYFFPFEDGQTHDIASATKSITSTLIGIAIGEHKLSGVDQRVLPIFSGESILHRDARKERMTISNLLTMRPGLDCHYDHGELTLNKMRASAHWVPFMLDLPMGTDPGSAYVYCSGGMHVLSGVVSRVTGTNAFAFARRDLFGPLSIKDASWPSDPEGVSDGWGDLHLYPRDMAKIGYLWLHNGRWDDTQIVPADYMRAATQVHSRAPWGDTYGYGIWVYPDRQPPIFEANGRGGQRISVIPSCSLSGRGINSLRCGLRIMLRYCKV